MQKDDKATVLVVDDELGVRQSFNMMLKGGYHILFAETGRAAIEVFEKNFVGCGGTQTRTRRRPEELFRCILVVPGVVSNHGQGRL